MSTSKTMHILKTGVQIGLVGGVAEIAVVCAYAAATGADAGAVAGGVAASFGIQPAVTTGIALHMMLASGLGAALYAMLQLLPARVRAYGAVPFMLASLAAVWAINFFIVLPAVSPSFVHLLPYTVTLASKLAFGATAAATLASLQRVRLPNRKAVPVQAF
jgi:hypothetical protein